MTRASAVGGGVSLLAAYGAATAPRRRQAMNSRTYRRSPQRRTASASLPDSLMAFPHGLSRSAWSRRIALSHGKRPRWVVSRLRSRIRDRPVRSPADRSRSCPEHGFDRVDERGELDGVPVPDDVRRVRGQVVLEQPVLELA